MDIKPNHSEQDDKVPGLVSPPYMVSPGEGHRGYIPLETDDADAIPNLDPIKLLRRYWMLVIALLILGASAGFVSVVLASPQYRARLVLEVQGVNEALAKSSLDTMPFDSTEVGIQTEINILLGGSFLRRGADRLQSESVPLAPTGQDLFSRLRQRVHPATQDPLENTNRGRLVALSTFDARPINRTKLIELTCESTSPDVAAQFLNAMANEFLEDTTRSRMRSSQKTIEWLQGQIEETKSKLDEAEERTREFVQASGNLFAGQDSTLDDTKLTSLKADLSKAQSERILKQTRYELVVKEPLETLPEVLDDSNLRGIQTQLGALEREKAALATVYTDKYDKIRKIDAQIDQLRTTYQNQVALTAKRIKEDFESAKRHETLLASAYGGQSQRVGSEAGKAAQHNALKREVEMLRTLYQTLLMQANQAGLSSSVPINPVRIVEFATTPTSPYKPVPVLNISFGTILGLVLSAGIIFLRERADRSIKSPGATRRLLNTPELGVIPNLRLNRNRTKFLPGFKSNPSAVSINGDYLDPETALVGLQNAPAFVTESFRGTLASILRNQTNGKTVKTILITSPGPGEGKTTVVQHLGIALAETGRKVLLIDGDFRCPHLHLRFGLPNEWSLSDILSETTPVGAYSDAQLAVSTGFPSLFMLPNRATQENVTKFLYSQRLRNIFETLTDRYDMVLVDAPPILHLADARILAPLTDALILVLRSGVTAEDKALEAYQRIREDGLFLLGTVLTDCDSSSARKLDHYYTDYANNDSK